MKSVWIVSVCHEDPEGGGLMNVCAFEDEATAKRLAAEGDAYLKDMTKDCPYREDKPICGNFDDFLRRDREWEEGFPLFKYFDRDPKTALCLWTYDSCIAWEMKVY